MKTAADPQLPLPVLALPPCWVSSVNSTVKGGVPTTMLGPKTLIIGTNGAGKTSITNSVELALTGAASDVGGRALVARDSDLVDLLLDDSKRASKLQAVVEITSPQGALGTASWTVGTEKGEKEGKFAVNLGFVETTGAVPGPGSVLDPKAVFPLRAVREALTGSPDKARAFFLSQIAGALTAEEVRKRLAADLHPFLATLGFPKGEASGPMVVKALLAALDASGKAVRDANARLKGAEAIAGEVQAGLAPDPTEAELAETQNLLTRRQDILRAVMQAASGSDATARLAERDAEIAALSAEGAAIEMYMEGMPPAPNPMMAPPGPAPVPPEVGHAKALLDWHVANQVDYCLLCGSGTAHGVHRGVLADRRAAFEGAFPAVVPVIHPTPGAERAQLEARMNQLRNQYSVAQTVREELIRQVNLGAQAPAGVTLSMAQEHVQEAQRLREEAVALRAKWESVRKAEAGIGHARIEATQYDALRDALKKIVKELLTSAVAAFSDKVQSYLPKGDLFGLELVDGTKEVFRVGLRRTARAPLRAALGEVERVRVWMAIAAALAKPGALQIIIPEDRAFDPPVLQAVMEALSAAPVQVILTHPIPPPVIPHGWHVVNTERVPR